MHPFIANHPLNILLFLSDIYKTHCKIFQCINSKGCFTANFSQTDFNGEIVNKVDANYG